MLMRQDITWPRNQFLAVSVAAGIWKFGTEALFHTMEQLDL